MLFEYGFTLKNQDRTLIVYMTSNNTRLPVNENFVLKFVDVIVAE